MNDQVIAVDHAGVSSPPQSVDVLFVIDILGSGGAQRQLCELAALLRAGGLTVHIATYHPADFYIEFLRARGVSFSTTSRRVGRLERVRMVWATIRTMHPRVVCAFLTGAGLITELGRLARVGKFRLIVSERHADHAYSAGTWLRLRMHMLADIVVANSQSQADFIATQAPWLTSKVRCIRNCVDLQRFVPAPVPRNERPLSIVVVGSYTLWKNTFGMLRAFRKFVDENGRDVALVDWYGNVENLAEIYRATTEMRDVLGLKELFRLKNQVDGIEAVYASADVLCLPAFSEATPNVVCEAMASGLPVIASAVGDIPSLVLEGVNGFLFDPRSTDSIAGALTRVCRLSTEERWAMGERNRQRAVSLFGKEDFFRSWLDALGLADRPGGGDAA